MTEFTELPETVQRVVCHANNMLLFWRDLNRQTETGGVWHEVRARQAYQDALLSLMNNGLIEGYDCVNIRTKIDGEWYSDRHQIEFVPESLEEKIPLFLRKQAE